MASKVVGPMAAIANIEKQMGNKGESVIFRFGDQKNKVYGQCISFGYPEIDEASNCAGIPFGKLVEIFGPESSGKSFITLKLIASAQKLGLVCCLVDVEQSFDPLWAEKHGVDVDNLFIINELMCAERSLDYVSLLCGSGSFGLVVVDSTAALIPKKELEGSMEDQDYALLARAMSKACRKIVGACGNTNCSCVFINQIRDNIGSGPFGDSTTTPGGKALRFYSHMRINVFPGSKVWVDNGKGEKEVIARKSYVTFIKNKSARPYGKCEIEIIFDEMAMNPVVKMVTAAKTFKLISIRNGEYYISKSVSNTAKNFATEAKTFPELAHFVVNSEYKDELLKQLIEAIEEEENEDKVKMVDPIVFKFKEDPSLWISPLGDSPIITEKKVSGKKVSDIIEEEGDEDDFEESLKEEMEQIDKE